MSQEAELHASAIDQQVQASYAFSNTSGHAITITGIDTTCGCATMELEKTTYLPGESGTINAIFTLGERGGEQNRTIVVKTDDPNEGTAVLRLKVHVPEVLVIEPKLLRWRAEEKPETKVLRIKVVIDDPPISVVSVKADGQNFATELKAIDTKTYEVHVTPKSLAEASVARIQIQINIPKDKPRTFTAFARIAPEAQPVQASGQ